MKKMSRGRGEQEEVHGSVGFLLGNHYCGFPGKKIGRKLEGEELLQVQVEQGVKWEEGEKEETYRGGLGGAYCLKELDMLET